MIDSTLVIVLHNGEQEIERELARRGRLVMSGDVLKVMARRARCLNVQLMWEEETNR